ncbi:MFS transporter [Uliginosibacterium flavum]|uniref:MFS transporter n=1 Tax=Uliginosibacterium flavum TaxID=1396831 RepID=A0ABV2TQ43_9RHOO
MPKRNALRVLASSTVAFTVCFAVWMMFAVLGIPLAAQLGLNETEFGLLAATPVLTGSLVRILLGVWTDRFGGRVVLFCLMLATVLPIWLIAYATHYWHFLVLGLFVGLAGGAFSVGTPYVARWFSRDRQGLAMGIFGAGNSGSALTKFVAPGIIAAWGWQALPKVYATVMLLTAALFWFFPPAIRLTSVRIEQLYGISCACLPTPECCAIASITRLSLAAMWLWPCG